MNTLLKLLLKGLLALIAVVVLGLFIASLAIDANRFKPEIESAAASAGIELAVEGDIAWQLLPLGIALNQVNFTLNNKSMAGNADQLAISVNFKTLASLISQSPQLPISHIKVKNSRVLLAIPNNLPVQLSQINLAVDNINTQGQPFTYSIDLLAPYSVKISSSAALNIALNDQQQPEMFSVNNLDLSINDLSIKGYIEGSEGLNKIQGQLSADSFNLIKQLKVVSRFIPELEAPRMVDPKALTDIAFEGFFDLVLDGISTIQSTLSIDGQAIEISSEIDQENLKLYTAISANQLKLDGYASQSSSGSANPALFAPLAIPMALWHGQSQMELNIAELNMGVASLTNIYGNLFGNQNIFRLSSLSGDLFDGQINLSGELNMQSRTPSFSVDSSVSNIDLNRASQLFDDLNLGGELNFSSNIKGSGYDGYSVMQSLVGSGQLVINSPTYQGINLEQTLCNAAALFSGKMPAVKNWSEDTQLDDLTASLGLRGDSLSVTEYSTQLGNVDFYGSSSLNLSSLRYKLNAIALATQSKSSAMGCTINPMIVAREIPFKCKGAVGETFNCKPDNSLIKTLLLSPKL
ncbi:AsmA family protein [Porticoccaceae bacterium]|nr:AsmA family protein [Porticoccaceae bacterium]